MNRRYDTLSSYIFDSRTAMKLQIIDILKYLTISEYLNCVLQTLPYKKIKNVVSFNYPGNFNYPVTIYNTKFGIIEKLIMDEKPDVYVSNMHPNDFEKFLDSLGSTRSYNSKATFIFMSEYINFTIRKIPSRFYSTVIQVGEVMDDVVIRNSSIKKCTDSNFPLAGIISKTVSRFEVKSYLKVCIPDFLPAYSYRVNGSEIVTGILIDIFNIVVHALNFSLKFGYLPFLGLYNATDLLHNMECDIISMVPYEQEKVEKFLLPFNNDFDNWYIPKPDEIASWKYLFLALNWQIWVFSISSATVLSFIFSLEKNIKLIFQDRLNFSLKKFVIDASESLIMIFEWFLDTSGTLRRQPGFILGFVAFASIMVINTLYKTRFAFFLLGRNFFGRKIYSLNDIVEQNYFVTYTSHLTSTLESIYPEMGNFFNNNFIESSETNWTYMVAHLKNTVAVKTGLGTVLLKKYYTDDDGRELLEKFGEPVQRSVLVFGYLQGNPSLKYLREICIHLQDHGFLNRIRQKYEHDEDESNSHIQMTHNFGLNDVKSTFFIWFVGIFIGTICFSIEYFKRKNLTGLKI